MQLVRWLLIWTFIVGPLAVSAQNVKVGAGGKLASGFQATATYAGCGAGPGGADIRDQSLCGNIASTVYETESGSLAAWEAACGSVTHLSTAPGTGLSAGCYELDNDVTPAGGNGVACWTIAAAVKLNLLGHTCNGRITMTSPFIGSRIFNGTFACSVNDFCVGSSSGSGTNCTDTVAIHHLTFSNANTSQPVMSQFDWSPGTNPSSLNCLQFYNITATVTTNNGSRSSTINLNSGNANTNALMYNLLLTCNGDATACQGVVCQTSGCEIRDSVITLNTNSTSQDGRGIQWDAGFSGGGCLTTVPPMKVHNIKIVENNNRAFRVRPRCNGSTITGAFEDNLIVNMDATSTGAGAIHIDDNGSTIQGDYTNFAIRRITVKNPVSGYVLYIKGGQNITARDIFLSGTAAGALIKATNWSTSGVAVTVSICTSAAFSSTINIIALKPSTDTTVVNAWASGTTDAASTGTVNNNIGPTGTPPTACPPSVL